MEDHRNIRTTTAYEFPTNQLFTILEDFSIVAIDVKFGEKSLGFVCGKNDSKQHKINQNSGWKSPKLKHNR